MVSLANGQDPSPTGQDAQVLDYGVPPHGLVEHEQNRFFLLRGQTHFMLKARVCLVAPPDRSISVLDLELEVEGHRLSAWSKTSVDVHLGSSGTRICRTGQEDELWRATRPLPIGSGEAVVRKVCGLIDASAVEAAETIEGFVIAREATGREWRSGKVQFHLYHAS